MKSLKHLKNLLKLIYTYGLLFRTFNLKIKPLTPMHFTSQYISELGLEIDIEKKVLEVL